LVDELEHLLQATQPSVIYTHNLADKHDTHVAVAAAVIQAVRRLPDETKPKEVYGVEVWRGLDWLPDEKKVLLDLSEGEDLALALIGLYESQIAGGKRYDRATVGRWQANATYFESHGTDMSTLVAYAIDLLPFILSEDTTPASFMSTLVDDFKSDVIERLAVPFSAERNGSPQ
jgi:LmbE family N-acetylglucosaminyl deacetylase